MSASEGQSSTQPEAASVAPEAAPTADTSQIEAEAETESSGSDIDSVYSSDVASITTSLASYAKRFQMLKGRKYSASNEYIVAIDETQKEQFDLFHEIYFRLLGKKLYVAPITENPQRILDLGTGTGIWAIECADTHPSAEVIGTDTSPIQPAWVPGNCQFQIDDYKLDFTFTKESFDFVHLRAIHGTVTDWPHLMRECFKVLKPGGWIEVVGEDVALYCDDGSLPPKTPIAVWMENIIEAMEKINMTLLPYKRLKEPMEAAGFDMSTYKHEVFPVPIGTWAKKKEEKELGGLMLANMLMGMEGWSIFIYTKLIGKSNEDVEKLVPEWHKDLRNKKHHKYMKVNAVYAQKPPAAPKKSEHEVK